MNKWNGFNWRRAASNDEICEVGNEISGVSKEIIMKSDLAIDIPMYGTKHSLNAAVAYGIAIYHIVEKYKNAQL
jgi:tRNA G18 (ribose-2'-O)-methylase SpoU